MVGMEKGSSGLAGRVQRRVEHSPALGRDRATANTSPLLGIDGVVDGGEVAGQALHDKPAGVFPAQAKNIATRARASICGHDLRAEVGTIERGRRKPNPSTLPHQMTVAHCKAFGIEQPTRAVLHRAEAGPANGLARVALESLTNQDQQPAPQHAVWQRPRVRTRVARERGPVPSVRVAHHLVAGVLQQGLRAVGGLKNGRQMPRDRCAAISRRVQKIARQR